MNEKKTKQNQANLGEVSQILKINDREAVTVQGAIRILKEVTNRDYTRDSVYRMFTRHEIEGIRTESANFYYVDSLRQVKRTSAVGRHQKQSAYSEEYRQRAIELYKQGKKPPEIAEQVGTTRQTIQNWIRKFQESGKLA